MNRSQCELANPKVLHIAPGQWAGHMRIYHRICKSLARAGYAVELIAHEGVGPQQDPAIKIRSLGPDSLSLSFHLKERFQRNSACYDLSLQAAAAVYHFHSFDFIPWAVRLRNVTRRPVIFDCMEDYEAYVLHRRGIPDLLRRPLAWIVSRLLRYGARNVDAVVVADRGTGELLKPYAKKLVVLHNFPDLALFPDPGINHGPKEFDLIYHGGISRFQAEFCFAVDDVLIRRGRALKWRFIGRMPERDWFRAELQRRQTGDRFSHVGLIPHSHVGYEVRKGRIGIVPLPNFPKYQTNIPQKMFEFMALRIPIVMSDLPPSRSFVGNGECALLVPADDAESYADSIIYLLDHPTKAREMGDAGRTRVLKEYNWEVESAKLLQLYADLLRRCGPP